MIEHHGENILQHLPLQGFLQKLRKSLHRGDRTANLARHAGGQLADLVIVKSISNSGINIRNLAN